jgi:hypothetical protein
MKPRNNIRYRHLLAVSLAATSAIYAIAPALADGTNAGTKIENTATGTFSDGTTNPDGTPKIYNTTSNKVVIEVSEIAGITITPQTPANPSPNGNDVTFVDFVITNTGNDPTQFFIPKDATFSGPAFTQNGPIQIVAVNGAPITPVNVTAGAATGALLGPALGSIAPNPGTAGSTIGTVTVRVPIKVANTAIAGNTTTVSLGQTATPAPAGGSTNNVNYVAGTGDVYTVDNTNGVGGETNTTLPVNGAAGVVEAMATSAPITVGARLQAFSAVLKAVTGYSNNNTPNLLSDDILTYNLALRVENPAATSGLVTSDLYGTVLNVDNSTATPYVLISDALPAGLQVSTATPPGKPANWTTVYTTDPLTTSALAAKWISGNPPATGVTRVGFIYNTTTLGPILKGSAIISGFTITLNPTAAFTGGQIANIAQTFGQSQPGTVAAGTPTQIVYDESGDQSSNNGLVGVNPDPLTAGGALAINGGITDGVADPTKDGRDTGTGNDSTNTGNTNQGTDAAGPNGGTNTLGGEATVYTIAATPLNGPGGLPGATGPTSTNDDFTNKSVVLPVGLAPDAVLTDAQTPAITFNNTVQNTSGGPQVISLLPVPPAVPGDLPAGTIVTLSDGTNTAIYTYNGTVFTFTSGAGPNAPTAIKPLQLNVPTGATNTANYTTIVDLPVGVAQLKEFPVTIIAFVDVNNDGLPANEPSNTTIDRLYTGYVSLVKAARILDVDGTTEVVGFTGTPAALGAAAKPGRIIEYQITYKNLSTPNAGTSLGLPANALAITEDGNIVGGNNWAATTTDPKYPTPATGSALDPTAGAAITVTTGGAPADIVKYVDTITAVAPGATGTFTFQRKIK